MFSDRRIKTSLFAIAADLGLTGLKTFLAWMTGSAALLADALHSATDLFVSLVLLGGLVVTHYQEAKSQQTNSPSNPKAARRLESILAIAVALVILYVPVEIISELGQRSPETLSNLWVGVVGTLVVIAIVHVMARLKTHVGQETDSPALEADGYHSKIDLFSSIAVLLSLVGAMVGIYLDEIAAVLIAVLIAVAGVELLVSGIRSLTHGDELDPISLLEALTHWCARLPFFHHAQSALHQLGRYRKRALGVVLAGGLLAYLASGFAQIPHGYTGMEQRFGATVATGLQPGLHYVLPWPAGALMTLPNGEVYSATVGSGQGAEGRLWQGIKATRVHEDDTDYLTTADENLINLRYTLQYRLDQPESSLVHTQALHDMIRHFTQSALWQQAAHHNFNAIMFDERESFAEKVAAEAQSQLASVGVPITVVDAQLESVQPPAMVVAVYHDRLNAAQEKEQRINRAEAQRVQDLLIAKAERVKQQAQVEAAAYEKALTADGEAQRFSLLANVFHQHLASVQFHQHLQTLVVNLQERPLLVTDPAIGKYDPRVWGQSPLLNASQRER